MRRQILQEFDQPSHWGAIPESTIHKTRGILYDRLATGNHDDRNFRTVAFDIGCELEATITVASRPHVLRNDYQFNRRAAKFAHGGTAIFGGIDRKTITFQKQSI